MQFNSTIDIGDLVSVVILLAGFLGIVRRMSVTEFKVNELWELKDRMFRNDH